ncbi:MAG: SlyX family protein [Alphaproteobacteria bacterium]|nr:SlyX family protein [Alphaproteobacteria bacterium]
MDENLIDLQIQLTEQSRQLEDLSQEVIRLSKLVGKLEKQYTALQDSITENLVKPLSEETRPPHY